jgi:hypothetical protein
MDRMILFFGPALATAGVCSGISVVGLILTTRALRRLRAEKLESDRALTERIFKLARTLAEKHAAMDRALAELKFKCYQDLGELSRMTQLADQAIVQFHQVRLNAARSPTSLSGYAGPRWPLPATEGDYVLAVFGRVDHIIEEIKEICRPTVRGVMQ